MPARPTPGPRAGPQRLADLASLASTFSPEAAERKRRLLAALESTRIGRPAALRQLHESLCFLQAYPDDAGILRRVDRLLEAFPDRIAGLGLRALRGLRGAGIANSTLEYPFGLPLSRWLTRRLGDRVDVAWDSGPDEERIAGVLDLLVTPAERDAFSEGGFTLRQWLEVARAGRSMTSLQVLIEAFDRSPLDAELRDWLYESLGLRVRVRLDVGVSRTRAKQPVARPFYHRRGLRRAGVDLVREIMRPVPVWRRAAPAMAATLVETARVAMVTRSRELHAFSYPSVDDVWVGELGRGLRAALIGLDPAFRLPFEGYYAFLALKNGVPVSYGGGWCLFETLEFGFNVFESFRQGESAWILGQALRAYRRMFGMRTVVIDPYQLGAGNLEALRSGAFYFYHRLGFRPRDREVLGILEGELARIARDRRYRSPLPVLRRLAREEVCLSLPGGSPHPERRLRARDLAGLVSQGIAGRPEIDRAGATAEALARVARALGVRRWVAWPEPERQAFRRWALVLALLPDLDRWSSGERARVVRMIRAKGGRGEGPYVRRLLGLARLRVRLEALRRPAPGTRGGPA